MYLLHNIFLGPNVHINLIIRLTEFEAETSLAAQLC